jgi:hypothetical protein
MTFSLSSQQPQMQKGNRLNEVFSQKELFIYRTLQFHIPTSIFKTSVFNPKNYLWDPHTQGKDFLGKLMASLPELEEQVFMDLS